VLSAIDFNIRALDGDPDTPDTIELASREALLQKLRLIQAGSRALLGIGYIDATGRLVAGSSPMVTGPVDLSDRPFFRALRFGRVRELLLSPPARASTTGEVGIPISRAVWNADGTFGGVVSGRLDPAYFERFFRSLGADAVAIALLDGTIVARHPAVDLLSAPQFPFVGPALRDPSIPPAAPEFVVSPVDGVERLVALRRLASAPVYVEVAFDRDQIFLTWSRRRNVIVGATATIGLLSVALYALARRRRRDFEARVHAEAAALVAAEAREAAIEVSKRKSEFLAHMSHEIRTPLNAIIGFAQMISGQMLGPVGQPRYSAYAADILYSAEHLLSVVNNVLDLSKVEAGKWSLESADVPVGELVEATCRLAAARAAHENVRIDVEPPPALAVFGDRRTLLQILLNLTINAIKFAGDDRRVTIACRRTEDGGAEIAVADSGPGMTQDDIARALRPFETASSVQARRRQDTGLGLPLARVFAELHEGALTLDSAPERGTTARLWLPAARVRAVA
jgi:signal transduction histidine kinase